MDWKKFVFAFLAVFIAATMLGFVIHAFLLANDYKSISQLYRPLEGQQARTPFVFLAYLSLALAVVWIYAKGVESKPWLGQGLRFGVAVWMLLTVPSFMIAYAIQPVPGLLAAKQIGFELIDKLILGALVAVFYRKVPPAA